MPDQPDGSFRTAVTGVREESPAPIPGTTAELVAVAAPMTKACRENLGQRVVVHIIGGMQAPGKLLAIDEDDGTITLASGENTYTVALHAIAVLVS